MKRMTEDQESTPVSTRTEGKSSGEALSQLGMTLIELMMSIAIAAVLAYVSIQLVSDTFNEDQFEQTRQKMLVIRNAMVGDPTVLSGNTRTQYGFLGDIGQLPTAAQGLGALTSQGSLPTYSQDPTWHIGSGWAGPYLKTGDTGTDYTKDGWGNAFLYSPTASPPVLVSKGAPSGTGFTGSITMQLPSNVYQSQVHGFINNSGSVWSNSAQVVMAYPSQGVLVQATASVGPSDNGHFSFSSIPMGVRALNIYIPSVASPTELIGPLLTNVSGANYLIPIRQTDITNPSASNSSSLATLIFKFLSGSTPLTSTVSAYPEMIQFFRASGTNTSPGTYYNSRGVITTAPSNVIKYSQDFSQSNWTKGTGITVTPLNTTAPDSTTTANLVSGTTSTGQLSQNSIAVSSGGTHTFSIYLKYPSSSPCRAGNTNVQINGPTYNAGIKVNLTSVSTSTYFGTGGNPVAQSITAVGNGWYRVSISLTDSANGTRTAFLTPDIGGGTCAILAWGAQVEQGSTPTSYIYTNSEAAYGPRFDYDPSASPSPTLRGLLLEGQSQNWFPTSTMDSTSGWATTNTSISSSGTAPDGTTATLLSETNFVSQHFYGRTRLSIGSPYGQPWVFSVYMKPSYDQYVELYSGSAAFGGGRAVATVFDLTHGLVSSHAASAGATFGGALIQSVGNGWYRCSQTVTLGSSDTQFFNYVVFTNNNSTASTSSPPSYSQFPLGAVYVWGSQLERGTVPTSYIPTTLSGGGSQTRNADFAYLFDLSWLDANQGTFYSQFQIQNNVTSGNQGVFWLAGNTSLTPRIGSSGSGLWVDDPTTALSLGSFSLNQTHSVAFGYDGSGISGTLDGATPTSNSAGNNAPTNIGFLQLGTDSSYEFLNGWLQSLEYFNSRQTNAQLQAITPP